jgi:hypothetical protein
MAASVRSSTGVSQLADRAAGAAAGIADSILESTVELEDAMNTCP